MRNSLDDARYMEKTRLIHEEAETILRGVQESVKTIDKLTSELVEKWALEQQATFFSKQAGTHETAAKRWLGFTVALSRLTVGAAVLFFWTPLFEIGDLELRPGVVVQWVVARLSALSALAVWALIHPLKRMPPGPLA